MQENEKLFGTSGIRGKFGEEITANLALNVGKALATYLDNKEKGKKDVVIGYDTRTTNELFENAITAGLLESGCNVLKVGMVPTPLVGYAVDKLNASAGIMITASHNPSEYNGIKVWNKNGMAYTPSQEEEIEEIYHHEKFLEVGWENIGKIHYVEEIKQKYIDDLIDIIDTDAIKAKKLKVVLDPASGAGSEISPLVVRMSGCELITLNSQMDGFFPGRNPEPNETNLQDLMDIVANSDADIGIAHDGDADRIMAIDDKGRISDFDKLLALISKYMVEKSVEQSKDRNNSQCKVITTVDAGLAIDESLKDGSGEIIRTKVGDVNVAEAIIEENAIFGGEPSGTWLHPDFCMCPDGILSGLRIIELVAKKGKLSELLDDIPNYTNEREKVICSKEAKYKVMDNMEEILTNSFDDIKEINNIDGVRISFKDGSWVLVRPSGTEDYVRITLEGKNPERAEFIKSNCVKIINNGLAKL